MAIKYINAKNNKFYQTNDNWKTFDIVDTCDLGAIREQSQNKVKEVQIINEFGQRKGKIIIEELRKIDKLLSTNIEDYNTEDNGYGLAFEVFAISVIHNFQYIDIIKNNIIFGDNDGKVDAIVFEKQNMYIYQIKMGIISNDVMKIARNNIKEYISYSKITGEHSSKLLEFCNKNKILIKDSVPMYYDISTNGTGTNHYNSYDIFDRFIINNIISQDLLANKFVLELDIEERINKANGQNERNFSSFEEKAFFMYINANTLISKIQNIAFGDKRELEKLFGFNVRGFVGNNKSMIKTIKDEPENFCLYNNGVSIVGNCTFLDSKLKISEAFIVNGQQTIFNLIEEYKSNTLDKELYIPLFIKNSQDNKILMNVAKYNNQQKAIKTIDLLAIDSNIRKIQKELYLNSQYYLNICSSGTKVYMDYVNKIYIKPNIIGLLDFLRAYSIVKNQKYLGSWKNNPSKLLEIEFLNNPGPLDLKLSIEACRIVSIQNEVGKKDKDKYAIASVALEYLYFKTNDVEFSKKVIDEYIKRYYDNVDIDKRKRNKADLFKTDEVKQILDTLIVEMKSK